MKKVTTVFTTVLLSISTLIFAQEKNNFKVGINMNQFQNDFGLGVHVISPYFANNSVAIKLGVNFQWLEHIDNDVTIWSPYKNIQLGFRNKQQIIENKLFVYGEGGTVLLIPNSTFSTKQTIFGGYGLFGFEFSTSNKSEYFIELGGMGTNAKADKIQSKPMFSNGFIVSTGLRFRL